MISKHASLRAKVEAVKRGLVIAPPPAPPNVGGTVASAAGPSASASPSPAPGGSHAAAAALAMATPSSPGVTTSPSSAAAPRPERPESAADSPDRTTGDDWHTRLLQAAAARKRSASEPAPPLASALSPPPPTAAVLPVSEFRLRIDRIVKAALPDLVPASHHHHHATPPQPPPSSPSSHSSSKSRASKRSGSGPVAALPFASASSVTSPATTTATQASSGPGLRGSASTPALTSLLAAALLHSSSPSSPAATATSPPRRRSSSPQKSPSVGAAGGAGGLYAESADWTELHRAVQAGDRARVQQLVAEQPSCVTVATILGVTPLHVAAQRGDTALVQVLLAAGAPLEAVDNYGATPLHRAAASRVPSACLELVCAGADVHARDMAGRSPAEAATAAASPAVAKVLRCFGPSAPLAPFPLPEWPAEASPAAAVVALADTLRAGRRFQAATQVYQLGSRGGLGHPAADDACAPADAPASPQPRVPSDEDGLLSALAPALRAHWGLACCSVHQGAFAAASTHVRALVGDAGCTGVAVAAGQCLLGGLLLAAGDATSARQSYDTCTPALIGYLGKASLPAVAALVGSARAKLAAGDEMGAHALFHAAIDGAGSTESNTAACTVLSNDHCVLALSALLGSDGDPLFDRAQQLAASGRSHTALVGACYLFVSRITGSASDARRAQALLQQPHRSATRPTDVPPLALAALAPAHRERMQPAAQAHAASPGPGGAAALRRSFHSSSPVRARTSPARRPQR